MEIIKVQFKIGIDPSRKDGQSRFLVGITNLKQGFSVGPFQGPHLVAEKGSRSQLVLNLLAVALHAQSQELVRLNVHPGGWSAKVECHAVGNSPQICDLDFDVF